MLRCRDVSELVTEYDEGTLPPGRRLAVRAHLLFCRMCRNYLDQMRKARRLLAGRTLGHPAADVEAALLAILSSPKGPGASSDPAD